MTRSARADAAAASKAAARRRISCASVEPSWVAEGEGMYFPDPAGQLTVDILCQNKQWILDHVEGNPLVDFIEVMRKPGQAVDLAKAIEES